MSRHQPPRPSRRVPRLARIPVAALVLAVAAASVPVLGAQQPAARRAPPTSAGPAADSAADSATPPRADAASSDDDEWRPPKLATGVTAGALSYYGGHTEHAAAAVVRLNPTTWLSIALTPTAVTASEFDPYANVRLTASGITDIPLEVSLSHTLSLPGRPSVALSYGATIPVGDTATGFGSGTPGQSVSVGVGFSPFARLGLQAGAGRALSDFSIQSSFNGTASIWGDAGFWASLSDRVGVSGGYSGDIGAVSEVYGRSRSASAGTNVRLVGPVTLTVNGSRGLGGPTPKWSFAVGLGTAFAMLGSVMPRSPVEELQGAFGGGRHGLPPASELPGAPLTPGSGTGRGNGAAGSGTPGSGSTTHGSSGTSGSARGGSGNGRGIGRGSGRGKP